jgi:curved DNA-binding protein CbpA
VSKADPLGYYRALNISPGASPAEIRLAYTFLKRAYREGRKHLQIGKIRAAYETLSNPHVRKRYDAGESVESRRRVQRGPDVAAMLARVNVAKTGLVLLLVGAVVLLVLVGPGIRAQFVSFELGDRVYWSESGENLGEVVAFEAQHRFATGAVAPAYRVRSEESGKPTWYPARDLERHCRAR